MRLNTEHHLVIVNFAEQNPQIITKKFTQKEHNLWKVLANQLNSLGYGSLTVAEYKRRISDWKSKTKSRAVDVNKSITMTGGGEGSHTNLTKIELRLLALMGNKAYEGDSEVKEMGFKKPKLNSEKANKLEIEKPPLPTKIPFSPSSFSSNISSKRKFSEQSPLKSLNYSFKTKMDYSEDKNPYAQNKPATVTSETLLYENEYDPDSFLDFREEILGNNTNANVEIGSPAMALQDHEYYDLNAIPLEGVDTDRDTDILHKATNKSSSKSTERRKNLSQIGEHIKNMNDETLDVLKKIGTNLENVNKNLAGINSSLKIISSVLTKKFI